jgi:hypothetical protein
MQERITTIVLMKEEKHVGLWILFEIHPNKHFSPAQMQETVGLYMQMIIGIVACISHLAMDVFYHQSTACSKFSAL